MKPQFRTITSVQNDEVKSIVRLHDARERREHKLFIAEGIRTCTTLLENGMKISQLFLSDKSLIATFDTYIQPEKIVIVSDVVMKKMSSAATPSGILCIFHIPEEPSIDQLSAGIILAEIADPGNVGTLIRSAVAMNKQTVVCIGGADPWSPKAIQSTAGYISHVNIFQLDWNSLVSAARKNSIPLIALVVSDGLSPEKALQQNSLIIIGNEARGIPDAWVADCDIKVTLPMPGITESLNASVAGSIALYLTYWQNKS